MKMLKVIHLCTKVNINLWSVLIKRTLFSNIFKSLRRLLSLSMVLMLKSLKIFLHFVKCCDDVMRSQANFTKVAGKKFLRYSELQFTSWLLNKKVKICKSRDTCCLAHVVSKFRL